MSDADRAKAGELRALARRDHDDLYAEGAIAAALAAERAAAVADLRARVEAVAEELENATGDGDDDEWETGYRRGLTYATDRIRAAVTDTTGGTQ